MVGDNAPSSAFLGGTTGDAGRPDKECRLLLGACHGCHEHVLNGFSGAVSRHVVIMVCDAENFQLATQTTPGLDLPPDHPHLTILGWASISGDPLHEAIAEFRKLSQDTAKH